MIPMFVKGALLAALVALLTVNALPAEEMAGVTVTPKIEAANVSDDLPQTTLAPTDDKNTTTSTTTTTTTEATTTTTTSTTPTTTSSTTPSSNTTTTSTTPATTTSTTPSSNTTTTTSTTPATPTTSTVAPSTTPAPTPVPHCNRFDPYSFVGGMILAYGSLAISLVLYKFYKTHTSAGAINNSNNYRTL